MADTVSVAINLPTGTIVPEDFMRAIVEAIGVQQSAGNAIAAAALGCLLTCLRCTPVSTWPQIAADEYAQWCERNGVRP